MIKRRLRRASVLVTQVSAPYPSLNEALHEYTGMVTTVRGDCLLLGNFGRLVERV